MILKKIAGLAFIISFLMAIIIFTRFGTEYIPYRTAKIIFLITGAIALMSNLLSFQFGKGSIAFNFLYWAGSIVLFIGLVFMIFHYPYSRIIILLGMTIFTVSFFVPSKKEQSRQSSDLLDDLD